MSAHSTVSLASLWHRLLLWLHIRNELDWAPPGLGPEVNHPYEPYSKLPCCVHCGGGRWNEIHREPFNLGRLAEIERVNKLRAMAQER
jgi:hypothetical protein